MATQTEIDNLKNLTTALGVKLTQALNMIHKKRGELGIHVNIDNEIGQASAVAVELNNFNAFEVLAGPQVPVEIPLGTTVPGVPKDGRGVGSGTQTGVSPMAATAKGLSSSPAASIGHDGPDTRVGSQGQPNLSGQPGNPNNPTGPLVPKQGTHV